MLDKIFWYYQELKSECWLSRHLLCEKILKIFLCLEVRILVERWNLYEAHIFQKPWTQTCRFEKTSLCLNTRLRLNKIYQNSHNFFVIDVNVCLLCAHTVMTSIILHTRRSNSQYKVCYALGFYDSAYFFSNFLELKSTFFTSLHFAPRGMY